MKKKLIDPTKKLIKEQGDELSEYVRENITVPRQVRFNEVFEDYLTRHLQKYSAYQKDLNEDTILEIRDFIFTTLRKLLSKSSSNDAVTDKGIDFITNVYMGQLNINGIENIIVSLKRSDEIVNQLTKQELKLYSNIFKMTYIGDLCDQALMRK